MRRVAVAIRLVVALMPMAAGAEEAGNPLVREQRRVVVQGVPETWQLVWAHAPATACGPADVTTAITCPCSGFAYGQYGKLALVRKRGDTEVERMDLGPLFDLSEDLPEPDRIEATPGSAILARWPVAEDDAERAINDDPRLTGEIMQRRAPAIMRLADYDRDGQPTKFLIQVGTLPCGHHQFVAVGVSARDGHLHALSSTARPDAPLVMPMNAWQTLLLGPGAHTVPTWACGDHGSEARTELVVSADRGMIAARRRDYSCPADGQPGKLLQQTDE
jgi:hypothetical protein